MEWLGRKDGGLEDQKKYTMKNEDAGKKVLGSLLRIAQNWCNESQRSQIPFKDRELREGFKSLGIRSFFVCAYDADAHIFLPPVRHLMVVDMADPEITSYLNAPSFREVWSALRTAVLCYLEKLLLELLQQKHARAGKVTCRTKSLRRIFYETIKETHQDRVLDDLPAGGFSELLELLSNDLQNTFGKEVLTIRKDEGLCELKLCDDLAGYIPYRVVRLDQRAATLLWEAFYIVVEPHETDQLQDDVVGSIIKNLNATTFWKKYKKRFKWKNLWACLLSCFPSTFQAIESGTSPTSLESAARKLWKMWVDYSAGRDPKNKAMVFEELNRYVTDHLPARAFAIHRTRWKEMLFVPVVVQRSLAGVFFAEFPWRRSHNYTAEEVRCLQALVQLFAAPTLVASSWEIEKERIQVERDRTRNLLRGCSHSTAHPVRTILRDLREIEREIQELSLQQSHDLLGLISEIEMRLHRMKDSTLTVTRYLGGQVSIDLRNHTPREAINMYLDQYSVHLNRLNISIKKNKLGDETFKADTDILHVIVDNLVHNAISHLLRPDAKDRKIRFESEKTTGARVRISVANSGPRILEERIERIRAAVLNMKATGVEPATGVSYGLGLVTIRDLLLRIYNELGRRVSPSDVIQIADMQPSTQWAFEICLFFPA